MCSSDLIRADGAVVVDDLAPVSLMDRIADELRPWIDATPASADEFLGLWTRRVGALVARSPGCRELVMHPLVLATMGDLFSESTNYQLHLTQAIAIGPTQPGQPVHRDQWAWDFYPFTPGFQTMCSCIWALTDFTEENGGTRVVPGSNHLDDGIPFTLEQTSATEMRRGSVLLFNGSVYHGGGPNRSDEVRVGIDIAYSVAWLRQEENQYLAIPHDVAATLPVDLLRLMGYSRGAYSLGYIDEYRDPISVVRPEAAEEQSKAVGEEAARQAFGDDQVTQAMDAVYGGEATNRGS